MEVAGTPNPEQLRQKALARYEAMGLFAKVFRDAPNENSPGHRHEGTWLFTTDGSARIKLDDGDWQPLGPGDEVRIQDEQLHEVIAGPQGWEYVFGSSHEEAKRQGILADPIDS